MYGFILGDLFRRLREERKIRGGLSGGFKIALVVVPLVILGIGFLYAYLVDLGYFRL